MGFLGSALQIVVGIVLVATGIAAPAGVALITGGLFAAAAIALAPDQTEASDYRQSPTYGFGQFRNPVKGDSPIPIIYSATGHKVAPVWLQAFVTPKGLDDDEDRAVSGTQLLSGLLAIGEGPIEDIEEIRFNDELVLERVTYEFGKGNGSKKNWTLPHSRIDLYSVEVTEGSTPRGFNTAPKSLLAGYGYGGARTFEVTLPEDFVDDIPVEFFNVNPATFPSYLLESHRISGVQAWLSSETTLLFHRDTPFATGTMIYMRYGARVTNGVTIRKNASKEVEITFATAPSSGTKLTATFLRKTIPRVDIYLRRGSAHQLPIWGFHYIRNTFGVNTGLAQASSVTKDTESAVNDVILNIASEASGFIVLKDDGGDARAEAQFKIEVKRQTPTSAGTNTFDVWYTLPDPRGKQGTKSALEFQVEGRSRNQYFWAFSVRNILAKLASRAKSNSSKDKATRQAMSDFVKAEYTVRVTRTSTVKSTNNSSYADDLVFQSITEVTDETLNLPGTALLGFHAFGTSRLNGGAPNITVVCKGKRSVAYVQLDPNAPNGYRWATSTSTQSNRVWAACDLIHSWRYGAGEHYDRDVNIDLDSAIECAAWLDESVRKGDGSEDTEVRSRLDIVLDTRKQLLEHLRDICLPGRIWVVLRGDTFVFVKDDAVDLDNVPTLYDDTSLGRTARNSLGFSHDTVVSRPTEIQVTYLDETESFETKQLWVVPREPGTEPRRIRRVTAHGTTRDTEVSRYGNFIYNRLRNQGANMAVGAAPRALDFGAGDVIRVVSNRVGIDGYWRVHELDIDPDTFFVTITGKQYVPGDYGGTENTQRIIRDGFTRVTARPTIALSSPAANAVSNDAARAAVTPAVAMERLA